MNVLYADTSALYALIDSGDRFHAAAPEAFRELSPDNDFLICSS